MNDHENAIPDADADGRIVLRETQQILLLQILLAFLCWSIGIVSTLFCLKKFAFGGVPADLDDSRILGAALGGLIGVPLGVLSVLTAIFPPKLQIDNFGITYSKAGQQKFISWPNLQEITCESAAANTSGARKTITILVSSGVRIKWLPVFGVEPQNLARYLADRQSHNSSVSARFSDRTGDLVLDRPTFKSSPPSATRISNFNRNVAQPILLITFAIFLIVAAILFAWVYWTINR